MMVNLLIVKMAQSDIAVQSALLIPKEGGITATLTFITPAEKMNIHGQGIRKGTQTILIANALSGTCLQNGTTTTTLDGDGKVKSNQGDLVREGKDGNTTTINGTDTTTSSPCSFSLTPKIQLSGQTVVPKVKVEHD